MNEVKEKDVVLSIALEMLRLNDHLEQPLEIYLTRYSDTFISLSDRTKLAKALKADLFVSLHCNHAKAPDAKGIEVYVSKVTSQFARDAIWMAFELQAAFKERLGFESRGVKFGDFQVLRETNGQHPSVLLELGFLSNLDEHAYLSNNRSSIAIARVILMTIMKY
ncbi:N-acetylmuramoyl-L-alanine amidase [Gelidibacter japonicus]|uniref:N-acetylmuramoyl-L-alanine amidase family protein n=1 Tax=Gelidibacter japonicus TaxID=1962232 RepID=UPI003969D795